MDRDLYEKGFPENPYPLHFASYGDPVFDRIIDGVTEFDLPDCIMPLTETVKDINADVISFAVACIDDHGQRETKLITRYSNLEGIVLDEETVLDETALADLKKKLHEMIRNEFDPTRSIDRLIQDNEQAGNAQAVLSLLIADRLFPGFDETEQNNFWQSVNNMDQLIADRDQLMAPNIPTSPLGKIKKDLLFDIYVPQVGETTSPTLPILLVESAVDTACRAADGMKVKKADLTIGRVKTRLRRLMEM
ncbi:MAG: hypothetical protein HF978_10205 [Desulfobacteraceae bacterium]|nr:hypothetical protein [Desulfobacteraceae bacterium]MBC2755909.1 hypothetical protein [Desulfobacteraceae bacterium]